MKECLNIFFFGFKFAVVSLLFWTCTHSCIYLFTFVYIWLHRVLVAACGRSAEVVTGGNSLAVGHWASHCCVSPVTEHGRRHTGFRGSSAAARGSRARAPAHRIQGLISCGSGL